MEFNIPPGSDLDNFIHGIRSPDLNPKPCLIICKIIHANDDGFYPDQGDVTDDNSVYLACSDGLDATALLDQLVKLFLDRIL